MRDGNVGYVSHVDGKNIKFNKFKYKYPAYTYPTESYLLDMCCVTDLHQEISINIDDIKKSVLFVHLIKNISLFLCFETMSVIAIC